MVQPPHVRVFFCQGIKVVLGCVQGAIVMGTEQVESLQLEGQRQEVPMLPGVRLPELRPLRAWWNRRRVGTQAGAPRPEAAGRKLQEATGNPEARATRILHGISDT